MQVAGKLAKIIRSMNQDMLDGIDALRAEMRSLSKQLGKCDTIITDLQAEVKELHLSTDALKQHGHHNNLCVSGIPESALDEGENVDTTAAVVDLANRALQLDPPVQPSENEVSQRLNEPRMPNLLNRGQSCWNFVTGGGGMGVGVVCAWEPTSPARLNGKITNSKKCFPRYQTMRV